MATDRLRIVLVCSRCGARNYRTTRRRTDTERFEIKKFCAACGTHTVHGESK